jgi:hypothetical protein
MAIRGHAKAGDIWRSALDWAQTWNLGLSFVIGTMVFFRENLNSGQIPNADGVTGFLVSRLIDRATCQRCPKNRHSRGKAPKPAPSRI